MMDRLAIACTTRLSLRKTRLYSSRDNVCRMATPRCALGVHCQHPQLALRSGHKCRRCRREVHVLCAEEDPQADASENLTCFFCTDPPKFPPPEKNQQEAMRRFASITGETSSDEDEVEEDDVVQQDDVQQYDVLVDDVLVDEDPSDADSSDKDGGPPSFRSWFEDVRNVVPNQRVAYIMLMMQTLDDSFNLEAHPYDKMKTKKSFRPTLVLFKKELKRRDPKIGVSNKKIDNILELLRGKLCLKDAEDIAFIKSKVQQYTATLLGAVDGGSTNKSSTVCRKYDRMRFIECMVLDNVKPLYFLTNEVMTRTELDSRNSVARSRRDDFFEQVSKEFNNAEFVPMSRIIPDLHEEFAEGVLLPLSEYRMSPDKARAIISAMRPRIMKIMQKYLMSGNGDGQRNGDDDDDDADADNQPSFNASNCIAGDNKGAFLGAGEGTDILYWWHVLEQEQMLQYTVSSLSENGAASDSAPSTLSERYERRANKPDENTKILEKITGLTNSWEQDNVLKRQANDLHQERMGFDRHSFAKRMEAEDKRLDIDSKRMEAEDKRLDIDSQKLAIEKISIDIAQRKINLDELGRVREMEKDLEDLHDKLDIVQTETKRQRIESSITSLKKRIADLES
jgi:hypothetical protein